MEQNNVTEEPKNRYKWWVVLVLVLALLAISNPSKSEYTTWVLEQTKKETGEQYSQEFIESVGGPMISAVTTRSNYLLFSIYTTDIEGEKASTLGVFNCFFILSGDK